jgi:hypothetical protein
MELVMQAYLSNKDVPDVGHLREAALHSNNFLNRI